MPRQASTARGRHSEIDLDDITHRIIDQRWYLYTRAGHDHRPLELLAGGRIGRGGGMCERTWSLVKRSGAAQLVIGGHGFTTCELTALGDAAWAGKWLQYERMPVRLEPLPADHEAIDPLPPESDLPAHFLKLYGLPRSGTNYLQWLLDKNFARTRVLVNETGWKHGKIPDSIDWSGTDWVDPHIDDQLKHRRIVDQLHELGCYLELLKKAARDKRLRYLVICKNPYSWYTSYARYRKFPASPVRRDWIGLWVEMQQHWLKFCDDHPGQSRLVRYEDLLDGGESTLTRELGAFGIERNAGSWSRPEGRLDTIGRVTGSFNPDDYQGRDCLRDFTPADLSLFASSLPATLMLRLHYPVATPTSC